MFIRNSVEEEEKEQEESQWKFGINYKAYQDEWHQAGTRRRR